jgi:pyruvate,orthophosphate dikinase
MFGVVVLGIPKHDFEHIFQQIRKSENAATDPDLSESALCRAVDAFKNLVPQHTGKPFPQNPYEQLAMAIEAVFHSWRSERAQCYLKLNNISDHMGTAVTVQAMVFENRGMESGTGVGFTRNPSTGVKELIGEFLANAQGEDIVAGTHTPMPIVQLSETMPALYQELTEITSQLEQRYKEAQDFEFTIENGKLFLLQTRTAKRAALAAVQTAADIVEEGLITKREALARVVPSSIVEILSPQLDLSISDPAVLAQGIPASPGAAVGKIALSAIQAVNMAAHGETVNLVTEETAVDDIHGMALSVGILTARGGATSHAAVVARGMGKCCITGAKAICVNELDGSVRIGEKVFHAGDWISLEGSTGRVFEGQQPLSRASSDNPALDTLLMWATDISSCTVRANADTPEDATASRAARAAGIGLCRTEHMFFAPDRLNHMRTIILATNTHDRVNALEILLPMQQRDFEELFRTMSSLPVTIRLLDLPLHEFLPSIEEINTEIAGARNDENWDHCVTLENVRLRVHLLRESNPMMGHRGCRLSLTYPEILQMQVRAILQAALTVAGEGFDPVPEIMVPLVASEEEMRVLARIIRETADEVFSEHSERVQYTIGTMIELPRAAVCVGAIAKHVSFISFGTNNLTQMTYGFSRDDARNYLDSYLEQGILKANPFMTIDQEGVGYLIEMAINHVRLVNPKIKIGVCGEHGGDPDSIRFFHSLGVDYVSCSPARIAVAQLAAAQAKNIL